MTALPIVIIGGGGHAKVLLSVLLDLNLNVLGFTDQNPQDSYLSKLAIPYLGDDDSLLKYVKTEILLVNGLGSIKSTAGRASVFQKFTQLNFQFATLIHPSAIIARDCTIEMGAQIMAGAIVQTGSRIGANTIVNTGARVDHDCDIGRHVHISPGAILSGQVCVEDRAHVGTGAVVIQGIRIGSSSVVGAGAVVIRDVKQNAVVVGVPAIQKGTVLSQ